MVPIGRIPRPAIAHPRRAAVIRAAVVAMSLVSLGDPAVSQEPAESPALRVFFDCRGFRFCDRDFYVREIPYVNHTRDREDAQVHVLVTSEQTGAGGQRFTLDFIGREGFEEIDDRVEIATRPNVSDEQVMTRIARRLQLGLARYLVRTEQSDELRLVSEAEEDAGAAVAEPEDDPWNFWTFRVNAQGFYSAQERQNFLFANGGLSANRITEAAKVQLGINFNYSESNFEISETETVKSITRGYNVSALFVRSAGDHWGWGAQLSAAHSSFSNEDLTVRAAPAIEYNVFPYDQSTRRQFRVLYSVGLTRLDYDAETIFFQTEEVVPDHRLVGALEVRQPWGSSRASLQIVQHLDDPARHRINLSGGVDLRLIRGLALNLDGGVSRVRDQINLAAGDATEQEILTRQRELETGFEYNVSAGFSYTFGSIFSNVVNQRFGGSTQFFLRNF